MRKFRVPLRFLLKRSGTVILRYGRPVLKSEVLGRGLTLWGRIIIRPLALTGYQKNWRNNHLLGINRRYTSLLKIYSNLEVSERIKKLFLTNARYNSGLRATKVPNRLEDYEIGSNIACGCDAAVYEARIRKLEKAERLPSSISANLPFTSSFLERKQSVTEDPVVAYPYALKIMYNYEFDASERHLWMDMGTELVPLIERPPELTGYMANMSFLPHAHPNIVQMYKAFTDCMPVLEDARRLYPEALPTADFYELIVDEPRTLFIVMRRYRMTLREYVLTHKRNYWFGKVMFGQLLEAIVYLYSHRISHRDIKSDNILLDFDSDDDVPHLVLSDFGCALATGIWKVRYDTDTVYLGGNLALRAPEIRCAQPAPNNWVDFHMADLWAAATIGYEIFTRQQTNPFYSRMRSDQYAECELPPLPKKMDCSVKAIIRSMLQIDPNKRPNPSVAANVLSISLFRFGHNLRELFDDCGFDETLFGGKINDLKNAASKTLKALEEKVITSVNDFVLLFAAETILARNIHPNVISTAELQLRATFLSRIDHECIWSALSYFYNRDNLSGNHPTVFTTEMEDLTFAAGDAINSVNNLINP
ncbi:NKF2 protein kinase [Loa loa]|uniref:non-specific serine/threonine protein kinase n=1 Tax=Loa loa TaxID=7209 RepID=A0A1S0U2M7_LOALO|nr:NKF2 protein kinase [Loa loa]EFO23498.2 NKF2 protein kinase [Loa loa]